MNTELLTHIKEADEEQREKLREWLSEGHGHSIMTPEYFTSRGLPTDFVNKRCGREWSNFVFVPDNCIKVSMAAHETHRPIGLFEEYGEQTWEYIITPRDMEAGHSVFYGTPRTHDTVWIDKSEWSDFMEKVKAGSSKPYNEMLDTLDRGNWADDYGEIIGRYIDGELHGMDVTDGYLYQVKHWHKVWNCEWTEDGHLKIEMGIEVVPQRTNGGRSTEEFVCEKEKFIPYLTRMEGGRRIEFINVHMLYNQCWYETTKGVNMEEIEETVDRTIENFKDENLICVVGGKEIATPEQWRSLSREELIQMHVDDRQKELDWYAEKRTEWEDKAPGVCKYVLSLINDEPDDSLKPRGWGLEWAQPMGYTDCMWNGNYFVPWVDGSGSSSMMHALCSEFDVDANTGMMGRGSHGRALGQNLLAFLKEEEVWGEEEE